MMGFQIYRIINTGLSESDYGYRLTLKEEGIWSNENNEKFDVTLDDWGEVTFVSCKPTYDVEHEYASFYLLRDEQILYRFPYRYEDNTMGHEGSFASVGAVAFRDINDDGKSDIIVIV